MQSTEWEEAGKWYDQIVGQEGHYYHKHVVLPKLLHLLDLKNSTASSLLDLGCGQGILARSIPSHITYTGVDLAPTLIASAQKTQTKNQTFVVGDACSPLPVKKTDFTHAVMVLSLQNMAHPAQAILEASRHLIKGGVLAIVLNHPCFRIPRHTSWTIDVPKKMQCRRIDRYLSPLQIPIQTNPGKNAQTTWSFHHSLSDYSRFLADAGFAIILLEEWTSDKKSTGKHAKMEDRARTEFPLFLTFLAQKL